MRFARRLVLASASVSDSAPLSSQRAGPDRNLLGIRVTRYRIALACLLVVVLAFYMWTAASSIPFTFSSHDQDVYNELTTAFLHGHTYLPINPPAGLLHLSDPYDPALNAPYNGAYHDLALYHGRFYTEWGPTPVLTLFAPFRITGLRLPESLAVALYAFVGLTCAILLLHALASRLVPRTPRWVLFVSSVGLALTNTLPFLLRRPIQYEVAISSGYCFEMAGLLLTVTAVLGRGVRRRRIAVGSLCLGLAIGGRPTLVVGGAVAFAAAIWEIRRRNAPYKLLVYALGPFVICGLALALYNHVRFGSFTDFGDRYELAGIDQTKAKFFALSYIVPGLLSYLVVPARLALTFPHAFLQTAASDPITLPHGYIGSASGPAAPEPAGGVFTTMPITLLLFSLPLLWWQRRASERRALFAATGLALLGLLIAGLLSWSVFATTERYEVDFATLLLIPGFLVWALLVARCRPGTLSRRAWGTLGVILTLFGSAVGTAISFVGYSDLLRLEHPALFASLEDITGPLATVATMIRGKPELARVDNGPLPVALPPSGVTEAGTAAWLGTYPVTLVVLSPGSRSLGVTADVSAGPGAPPPSALTIRVDSPGRKALTVPVISRGIRLPISVHWGLNRIRLTLVGRATLPEELELSGFQLSP